MPAPFKTQRRTLGTRDNVARPLAGAALRSIPVTARALTKYRVRQLKRSPSGGELRRFVEHSAPGSMTVDVGASVGNFALASARAVGRKGRVLALEPNPAVFSELVNSTWGTSVTPLNLAASNQRGPAVFEVPLDAGGGAVPPLGSLEHRSSDLVDEFKVRTVLIDDLVPPHRVVSAIKVDVEGHELSVLKGSVETIKRCRPALVVEIEGRHLAQGAVADVAEWVFDLGYLAWGIRGDELLPWAEFDAYEWQERWLDPTSSSITAGNASRYLNNFLFLPRS
jgi:FkbM family methyltransferase